MARIRTGYSFRTAVGTIDEVLSRLQEIDLGYAPITDRASTFGYARWAKAAKAVGLRPVFGVELAVAESSEEKKPSVDYWTFIAKDSIAPISRLISLATDQFRYEPLIEYQQAIEIEGVWKIAGHRAKLDLIPEGADVLYGLGPSSVRGHVTKAVEKGMRLVAVSDNFMPRREDKAFYEVLTGTGRGASIQTYDQHIQTDEEWFASIKRTGVDRQAAEGALAMRGAVLSGSRAVLQRAELIHPERPKPLREMCEDGAAKLGVDLSDPVYSERLEKELRMIAQKDFEDYFYLVSDICRWARKRMAVGPARGSSCGSLVCYLLEITKVDPIPFGLIFERFIDINRADLPDIDIDFSDQERHQVFKYLEEKYGEDRVARLGTVTMYKAKSALGEAGVALKIPPWKIDAVSQGLVERSSADSRATDTIEDTLKGTTAGREVAEKWPGIFVATRMEGHPRHYSQHAAGVVVSDRPIEEVVAVDVRTGATMCDKKDAEGAYNLLKIDCLGLTQLSIFEDCLSMAGLKMSDLEEAPLDDPAAFDVLNKHHFSGIFQWNGAALQGLTRQIKADKFEDVVAISALARPGPMSTGGSHDWVVRRMTSEVPPGLHPLLDELTKDTYGVIVFQEQVMRIVREMGGLSWEDTSDIRKAMSNTLGDEYFAKFRLRFVEGAGKNGVSQEIANKIWERINTFGAWAFNKSHAVAYGYISYWCCWLKAHYPFEFAAATLTHQTDPQRQIEVLREMASEGIEYIPVDAQTSLATKWTTKEEDGKKYLVGPLISVKGIGPKIAAQIVNARETGATIPAGAAKRLENPETPIDSLWPVSDAVKRLLPDPAARNIHTPPTPIADLPEEGDVLVFATPMRIDPRDENEEVNIIRRKGVRVTDGPTEYLQMILRDDTGIKRAKINRWRFKEYGQAIIDRSRIGTAIYAFKGTMYKVDEEFSVLSISKVRYLGDMERGYEDA